jgi:hypothetical protein
VDGASTPSVQRKLGKPCRQERNGDWSIQRLCSWAVLIAEVDEKRENARSRPAAAKPQVRWRIFDDLVRSSGGSASRRRVKQRRRGYSSREGVLAAAKRPSLTRRRWRRSLAVTGHVVGWGPGPMRNGHGNVSDGWSRQRSSEAKLHARRAAEKAAVGKHGVEELDQAPPGPGCARTGLYDSGVVAKLKLEGRRQAKLHPRISGVGRHAGCSCRESVAEVGETHLSRRRGEARGNS